VKGEDLALFSSLQDLKTEEVKITVADLDELNVANVTLEWSIFIEKFPKMSTKKK